jgi:hypothetical protein
MTNSDRFRKGTVPSFAGLGQKGSRPIEDVPDASISTSLSIADDLMIGAEPIAVFLYNDPKRVRDVYRNPMRLSFFKHGAQIAATKSGLIREIRDRETAARKLLAAKKEAPSAKQAAAATRRGCYARDRD